VPVAYYDEAKEHERKFKADALDAAETKEEKARIEENWIFDDFYEEDYHLAVHNRVLSAPSRLH
jgi:hypothetical protein